MASWPPCSHVVLPLLHNLSRNLWRCFGEITLKKKTFGKHLCTISEGTIIFDREAKRIQRNRAAQLDDYDVCQYVKVSYLIFTFILQKISYINNYSLLVNALLKGLNLKFTYQLLESYVPLLTETNI